MSSQAIKEYDDFAGQDGYVIVDGLDNQTPGGKKLLSTIGGGGSGWTKVTIDVSNQTLQQGSYVIDIPSNNTLVVVTGLGTNEEYYDLRINPPTVGENEVINCAIEFKPVHRGGNTHCIYVDNMTYCAEYYSGSGSYFDNEYNMYQITLFGSVWRLSSESDE